MNLKQLFLPRYVCALLNLVLFSLPPTYAAENDLGQNRVKKLETLFDEIENGEKPKVNLDVKDWNCIITTEKLFSRLISSNEFFYPPYYILFSDQWQRSETGIEVVIENRTIFSYLLRKNKNNVVTIIGEDDTRKNLIKRGLKEVYKPIWFKDTYQQKNFFFILITTLLHHAPTQLQELLIKELLETFIRTLKQPFSFEDEKLKSLQDILEENYLHTSKYTELLNQINTWRSDVPYALLNQNKSPYRLNIEDLLNLELAHDFSHFANKLGKPVDVKSTNAITIINQKMKKIEKCIEQFYYLLEKSYEAFHQPNNKKEESLANKVEILIEQASRNGLKNHANLNVIIPTYITNLCKLYTSIQKKSSQNLVIQIAKADFFKKNDFSNNSNNNNNSYLRLLNSSLPIVSAPLNPEEIRKDLIAGHNAAKALQKEKEWKNWCAKYDQIKEEEINKKILKNDNPYKNITPPCLDINHCIRVNQQEINKILSDDINKEVQKLAKENNETCDSKDYMNIAEIITGFNMISPIDDLYNPHHGDGLQKIDQMKYLDVLPNNLTAITKSHKNPQKFNEYLLKKGYYNQDKQDQNELSFAQVWAATSPLKSAKEFTTSITNLTDKKNLKMYKEDLVCRIVTSTINKRDVATQWDKIKFLQEELNNVSIFIFSVSIEELIISPCGQFINKKQTDYINYDARNAYLTKIKQIPKYKEEFNKAWQSQVTKYINKDNNKYKDEKFSFPSIGLLWTSNEGGKIFSVTNHLLVYYTLNNKDTFMQLIKSYFEIDEQDNNYQELLLGSKDEYFYDLRSFFLPIPKYGLLDNDITSFVEAIDKYLFFSEKKKQVARYFLANYQREFTMKDRKKLAELGGIEGYIPTPNSLLDYLILNKEDKKQRSKFYRYLVFFNEKSANKKLTKSEQIWSLINDHIDFYNENDKELASFLKELETAFNVFGSRNLKEVGEYLLKLRHMPKNNFNNALYFSFYQTFGEFFRLQDFFDLEVLNPFSNKKNITKKHTSLNNYGDILFPVKGKSYLRKNTRPNYTKRNYTNNLPNNYKAEPKGGSGYYNDTFFDNPEPKSPNPRPNPNQENKKMEEKQTDLDTSQSTTDSSDEENPSFSFVRLLINHRLTITVLLVGLAILTGKKVSELIQQKSANKKEEKNENKDEKQTTNQKKMVKSLKRFRRTKLSS